MEAETSFPSPYVPVASDGELKRFLLPSPAKMSFIITHTCGCEEGRTCFLCSGCTVKCYMLWLHGYVFCEHNNQLCGKCGEVWFRFDETPVHATKRLNEGGGTCVTPPKIDLSQTLIKLRQVLFFSVMCKNIQ